MAIYDIKRGVEMYPNSPDRQNAIYIIRKKSSDADLSGMSLLEIAPRELEQGDEVISPYTKTDGTLFTGLNDLYDYITTMTSDELGQWLESAGVR